MKIDVVSALPSRTTHPVPLLFVHGAWHGAWCWQEHFLPYFCSRGYASWALDLRGHQRSEGREQLQKARMADYVADVAEVAARLPAPPVVIGHSMGGLVVQKYLENHAAPAAVLLASAPVTGALGVTLRTFGHHPLLLLKVNLTRSLLPLVDTPALARESFFSTEMPEEQLRSYAARLQDESYLAYLDMIFSRPHPEKIATPVLVIGAGSDRFFTPREHAATAKAYHTEAVMIPSMPHDMMLDARWESAAEHVLGWLAKRGI